MYADNPQKQTITDWEVCADIPQKQFAAAAEVYV